MAWKKREEEREGGKNGEGDWKEEGKKDRKGKERKMSEFPF